MKALFFIGLVIPEPLAQEIQALKTDFSSRYQTRHGLLTMPHITLEPPFRDIPENLENLSSGLRSLAESTLPFEIVLDGYGHFRKQVIFIHVVANQAINDIAQAINKLMNHDKVLDLHEFRPHITIAHRDLSIENFEKAWEVLKNRDFKAAFKCESISVLVHRNGRWEIHSSFKLGPQPDN